MEEQRWTTEDLKQACKFNILLRLHYTEYTDAIMTHIVNNSGLKRRIDLAIDATECILSNLYYADLQDLPLAIVLSRSRWVSGKGIEWASLDRISAILKTMEKLKIIRSIHGFYGKDKKYCGKYWLNITPPIDGIKVCLLEKPSNLIINNEDGTFKVPTKNNKFKKQNALLNKYNSMMDKQEISFSVDPELFIKKGSLDPERDILNTFSTISNNINLGLMDVSLNGRNIVNIKTKRTNYKVTEIIVIYGDKIDGWNIDRYIYGDGWNIEKNIGYRNTDIGYRDTDIDNYYIATRRIRGEKVLRALCLCGSQLLGTTRKTGLTRVFCRGSECLGGRFYSDSFSSLPRVIRKNLMINGEPVVEPDYSGLHIRMLYHLEGLEFKGECYVYPKEDGVNISEREKIKLAQLILINARTKRGAPRAVFNKLQGLDHSIKKIKDIQPVIDQFMNFHGPIKHHLCSDKGVELQFLDSEIMLRVIQKAVELNIPIIPIHDSIVCSKQYDDTVKSIMRDEYKTIMSFYPVIE